MATIVIVDDEVHVGNALRRLLLRAGHSVELFSRASEALTRDSHVLPDMVISDFRMPEMTGSELLAQMRHRYPECVCVILTGDADDLNLNSAVVNSLVRKPWVNGEMLEHLHDLLVERT
ncbi:MAG: response regulator [Myxococcaceae bacterium]|nr:response regulator [Myxococcaceae bacterium]